ncbi:ABC transporter permease [Pectinatus frisingensis]|jgi:ABC-2 type transport system permease protein|uniref:ABC transporter permease n=1 Tax=Pectinatus frisingensis TaxID=865 RepID=UPI0018C70978|nr:ABC transporter permease [Pectinatus frisingensis]
MRKFLEIVRYEHHALWRRPFPAALFFLTPLLFCIFFGMIYKENTVRHIPVVIYDQDQSNLSRSFIKVYRDSDRFDIKFYADTQEQMTELLSDGKVQVGLGIPADFSEQIKSGRSADIILLLNSANNIFANSALVSIQENNRTFSVGLAQKLVEGLGVLPNAALNMVYPVHIGVRLLNNPTTGYTPFMLPGIVLNGLQIALLVTVTPLLSALCRRNIYGLDYSSLLLMTAKAIPYWFLGLISYAVSLAGLTYLWAVPIRAQMWKLLLLGGFFIFAVIGVLYLFSAISPDETLAVQLPLLYIMPGLLFSGLSWPLLSMRGFSKWFSSTMPITYAGDCMRDLMLAGYCPDFSYNLRMLLIVGITAGSIAWCIFTLRRYISNKTV